MRLLVISDSHGHRNNVFYAVENEPTAEIVYFLGDGANEYEQSRLAYGNKKAFIGVKGNCDFYTELPINDIRTVEGKKIYATHGYAEHVKYGLSDLKQRASDEKCNIVLFGHTHTPQNIYEDGIYYFNPGSIHDGKYGVIDITDSGIMCINKKIPGY